MARAIYKYPIPVDDTLVVGMPDGAQILTVQVQDGQPCLWALVDPTAALRMRHIDIYGTGHPMAEHPGRYIGTFQLHDGRLIFHVFDPEALG